MPLDGSELILVAGKADLRERLGSSLTFQGVHSYSEDGLFGGPGYANPIAPWWFASRTQHLEQDETILQAVTYVTLRRDGKHWAYRRGKPGTESRLHGNISIGVGGHVDIGDFREAMTSGMPSVGLGVILFACDRELAEELGCDAAFWNPPSKSTRDRPAGLWGVFAGPLAPTYDFLGLIHDPTNPVGRVHLGFVYAVQPPDDWEPKPSDDVEPLGWLTLDELKARRDECEGWTQILVDHLAASSL